MKRLTWKHIVAINVALLVVIIGGFYIREMVKESYLFDEHLKKGSSYMNQGKWGPASVEFAEASKIRPESYESNYGYGAALLKLRQLDKAVPALENAARLALKLWRPTTHSALPITGRRNMTCHEGIQRVLKINSGLPGL